MSRSGGPPGQQPLSFKTVPNRNKTQKWQQAKSYNYDGDDWGGYDPYDEYGSQDEPQSPPAMPQIQGQPSPGMHPGFSQGGFAPPQTPFAAKQVHRTNSFDAGDDRRVFGAPQQIPSPGSGRMSQDYQRRDFSQPQAVPAPLNMRSSPAPTSDRLPPRKSSLGMESEPARQEKELPTPPVVRPADIYKRMAAEQEKERQRQSQESSRPSMDSVQREAASGESRSESLPRSSTGRRQSLDPVTETKEPLPTRQSFSPVEERPWSGEGSKEFSGFAVDNPMLARALGARVAQSPPHEETPTVDTTGNPTGRTLDIPSPVLPPVRGVSGFGSDFLQQSQQAAETKPLPLETEPEDTERTPTSPQATRAAPGADPASEILNERMPTRAQPGHDPAADILAERQAQHGDVPIHEVGRPAQATELQHQPSRGFTSVVHQAFDRQDDSSVPPTPISRDNSNSNSGSGVSRSNTDSTSGISPIMSRVPSAATAQARTQQREEQVPSIAEESVPTTPEKSRPMSGAGLQGARQITRKPSPGHSRNVSAETARSGSFEPGYRRNLETPSPGNSPARTPNVESNKRLSNPMIAEMGGAESPAVTDQAAEMPVPHLEQTNMETPAFESTEPFNFGTRDLQDGQPADYSTRESDLADTVNSSPDKAEFSPVAAEAEKASQQHFLRNHSSTPTSPTKLPSSPSGMGIGSIARPLTPKGRVREIAGKYNEIDEDSRRNSAVSVSSKSSWSNSSWAKSEENLNLKRSRTFGSQRGLSESDDMPRSESPMEDRLPRDGNVAPEYAASSAGLQPELARPQVREQKSFRPHLPGEWTSYAETPAGEQLPVLQQEPEEAEGEELRASAAPETPRASRFPRDDDEVDLTPTTKKTTLPSRDSASADSGTINPLANLKAAGEAMGAMFVSSMGAGQSTRDFASKEPEESEPAVQKDRLAPGNVFMRPLQLDRTASSIAPSSVASSAPPTPPAKDTPRGLESLPSQQQQSRPISGYFSAPAPLKSSNAGTGFDSSAKRPTVLPSLSTDTSEQDLESDRLRKEIVRTLNPAQRESIQRQSIMEDNERTQDALDAPENMDRVNAGENALPAAEIRGAPAPESLEKPGLLDQRFSWENRNQGSLYNPNVAVPDSPARASYERPRSNAGLHVVNANVSDDLSNDSPLPERTPTLEQPSAVDRELSPTPPAADTAAYPVSPITQHEEMQNLPSESPEQRDLTEEAPSPMSTPEAFAPVLPTASDAPYSEPPEKDLPSSTMPRSPQRIPPFREILAIKSPSDRISAYNSTRQQFASADTGLGSWLTHMTNSHPEHTGMTSPSTTTAPRRTTTGAGFGSSRHKHSPSLAKFTSPFAGGGRQASVSEAHPASNATSTPGSSSAGGGEMAAKGKDMLKTAGVLGGKGVTGAKGLFAKGKSRFASRGSAGDKAPTSSLSSSTPPSASDSSLPPPPPSALDTSLAPPPRSRPQSNSPRPARPLSATFARLRRREGSRSKSRPESLVLGGAELDSLPDGGVEASEGSLEQATRATQAAQAWAEPWNADAVPQRSETPGRLGVLPSPGVDVFPAAVGGADAGTRENDIEDAGIARQTPVLESKGASEDHEPSDTRDDVVDEPFAGATSARPLTRSSTMSDLMKDGNGLAVVGYEKPEEDDDELYSVTPVATRAPWRDTLVDTPAGTGTDALAGSNVPLSKKTPNAGRTANYTHGGESDELYSTTPIATRAPWRNAAPTTAENDEDKMAGDRAEPLQTGAVVDGPKPADPDDSADDLTPQANATVLPPFSEASSAQDLSRPLSRESWEKQSMVSAEEHFTDADDGPAAVQQQLPGSAESRRSSVSSLGSPDTVVQPQTGHAEMAKQRERAVELVQQVGGAQEREATEMREEPGPVVEQQPPPPNLSRNSSQGGFRPTGTPQFMQPPADRRVSSPLHVPNQNAVAYRQYRLGAPIQERPMSYVPLPRDGSGFPAQESLQPRLNTAPPLGRAPFGYENGGAPTGGRIQDVQEESPQSPQEAAYLAEQQYPSAHQRFPSGESTGSHHTQHDFPEQLYGYPGPETQGNGGVSEDIHSQRFAPRAIDPRQHGAEYQLPGVGPPLSAAEPRSKRYSGFFRGPSPADQAGLGTPPGARINPDRVADDSLNRGDDDEDQQRAEKQTKRRSGIFSAFSRSPSVTASDLSRSSTLANSRSGQEQLMQGASPAQIAANRARENAASQATQKKPQRAVSAATPPEPAKKKRFGGLGSLFGRSSTQGHNTPKPNKLTKMHRQESQSSRQEVDPVSSFTNYSAYEAMRRQQIPNLQVPPAPVSQPTEVVAPPANRQQALDARDMTVAGGLPPPPGGWYAPTDGQGPPRNIPQTEPAQPAMRRLHSEGFRPGLRYENIPDAFKPVNAPLIAGYSPPQQVRPRPGPQYEQTVAPQIAQRMPSGSIRPVSHPRQFSYERTDPSQYPVDRGSHARQMSSGSLGNQLSPQVSAESPYSPSGYRPHGSAPSISPVQTRSNSGGFQPVGGPRMGSLSQEVARSPAQDHPGQQTPWSINMPRGANGSQQSSRASSWAYRPNDDRREPVQYQEYQSRAAYENAAMQPPQMMYPLQPSLPMSPQSPQSPPYANSPRTFSPPPPPPKAPLYGDPRMEDLASVDGAAYPSPPYSPASPYGGQQQQQQPQPSRYPPQRQFSPQGQAQYQDSRYTQQRPPPGRYYGQSGPGSGPPPQWQQQQQNPPPAHMRAFSGNGGRYPPLGGNDERIEMRGASYPGQEWAPSGMAGNGWD